MKLRSVWARTLAIATSGIVAITGIVPAAVAGPGYALGYSRNANPMGAPDVVEPTYYANSPLGLRPDPLGGPNSPMIDTGTPLRKFVDILPSVPGLAPTTNAGTGVVGANQKYIPLAIPGVWPTDNADYYHLAAVEYTEQLHSDLPKASTLRGYVQIEEPGQATPNGSKHIPLTYPNGTPITLPDVNGNWVQVYGYDIPHYLGPVIVATKDRATRIKYSNLLPPGAATCNGVVPSVLGPCAGVVDRHGDLPLPVDATLAGGALQQNRIDVHLHGGLTPWISDGNPHQWTIPVGDTRYGNITDIAVTAGGSRYAQASTSISIDPPQSRATGTAVLNTTTGVARIDVSSGGGFYSASTPPTVTVAAPTLPPGTQATATATASQFKVATVTAGSLGTNYAAAPIVTVSAPDGVPATATGTANLTGSSVSSITRTSGGALYDGIVPTVTLSAPTPSASAVLTPTVDSVTGASLTAIAVGANYGYFTAPAVTIAAPKAAVNAVGTATLSGNTVGSIAVNNTNFGYYTTAPVITVAAPTAAVNATGTAALGTGANNHSVASITVNPTNFGYFTVPAVSLSAPPAAVAATATATITAGAVSAISVNNTNFGYFTNPTVTISAPAAAVTATGSATVSAAGALSGLAVTNGGSGYVAVPAVTLSAPPATVQGSGLATLSGQTLGSVAVSNAGFGYWTPPTVTVSAPTGGGVQAVGTPTVSTTTGAISAITVNTTNAGYTVAPTITIGAPPARVTATATATLAANGSISALNVTNAGFGYWAAAPAVTISAPAALPATATATATVTTAKVVTITRAGSNYTAAPRVTVAGGTRTSGTAWTATATINAAGQVTSIAITGTGVYSAAPTLTIAAPARGVTATATAVRANGVITGFTITNAGSGYTTAPTVTIAQGTAGTQATATATIAGGKITGVTMTNQGAGYSPTTPPTITIGAPNSGGTPATVTAQVANGRISGFTVTNAGAGYSAAPTITVGAPTAGTQATATASIAGGAVTGLAIANGGAGYDPTLPPTVTIAAPTGRGTPATATATLNGSGVITGFTITGGSGYTTAPTVTISAPTASVNATATATINGAGKVSGYTVTTPGTNYLTAPTVTVGAATASVSATATAAIANGSITGITVTNPGSGYTTVPAVTIPAATPSVNATATAAVSGGVITGITMTNTGLGYSIANPPACTVPAPTASVQATATATLGTGANYGQVTGFTVTNGGSGYATAPTVTVGPPPALTQATVTAALGTGANAGKVTTYTITNPGWGYIATPIITVAPPYTPTTATATAIVEADGTIGGFTITNPGAGYSAAPAVTIDPPANYKQATATVTVAGGAVTGVTLTDAGGGYLSNPNVTVKSTGTGANAGSGATVTTLISTPVGPGFFQVPDMVGNAVGPANYTPPIVGEGTLYYTNNQSERLMWYHDHTSGTTRLNVYEGLAAPFWLRDPNVDPVLPGQTPPATLPATSLQGYVPGEVLPLVIQEKTFVPKDIALQDARWDQAHWGQYGDLWFPHVYETNQNPSMLASASAAGRWDWGPWFAIVYPSMYQLPSGKYGDVTTTPEAFQDSMMVNGVAFPTVNVEPRAYRLQILNAANDRFVNLGIYKADPLQVRAGDGAINTEVLAGPNFGDQPTAHPGNVFADNPANAAFTPWPTDGRWAPLPSEMGPPFIQIGNEGGMLPKWVEQDPIPANFDYNRRSVTVLNTSQDNDVTQGCYPKCHGLYMGPAERADVIVDFSKYAGQTLIVYNDQPAPNPGFDPRIDYFAGNDPGNAGNYVTGGAPNVQIGYAPNTRTIMQFVVGTSVSAPIDYMNAATLNSTTGFYEYNPLALGVGRVVGQDVGTPGQVQVAYAMTQAPPIVGQAAYNAVGATFVNPAFSSDYVDQTADMFLASQNEPMFFVTNPGALTLTAIAVTGQTTAVAASSGVGTGTTNGTTTNPNAGSGTGYLTPPTVRIDPPQCMTLGSRAGCSQATGTATVAGGEVTAVTLTNAGAGYTTIPAVTLVSGGTVVTGTIMNQGSGYTVAPNATISGGGGTGATASTTIDPVTGKLLSMTITNPGSGYNAQPVVAIDPPSTLAASGLVTLSADTVGSVSIVNGGQYPVGTVPTVTFDVPPPNVQAVISATPFGGICCIYTIVNGGTGYTTAPTLTISDSASPTANGATAVANVTNGVVTSVTPTATGTLNYVAPVVVTTTPPAGVEIQATGHAVMDATQTTVASVVIDNSGSGYQTVPNVTFSGGTRATAVAGVGGGGTGATAVAIASTTKAFVVPAAMPNSGVPLSASAVAMTLPPTLANLMGCNAAQTSCPNASSVVVGRLMNPAIQELFEPFYGRMNATLGIEMPNQSLQVQTTLPLNYIDRATEQLEPNGYQMWKVTHNGVDAHPVHIHLVNAQLINRVGWDGTVKPMEDNENGWKETIKMNPLEDIILVMQAAMPHAPFGMQRSIRSQDPSQPLGVNMGFTQFYVGGLNGTPNGGLIIPADAYPTAAANAAGNTVGVGDTAMSPIVNSVEDYDQEYVWHCHILGHEENDFMRPLVATSLTVPPAAPTGLAVSQAGAGQPVVVTWVDPTPISNPATYGNPANELGFTVERCTGTVVACSAANAVWQTVVNAAANTTTATDKLHKAVAPGTTVSYRVRGWNAPTAGKVLTQSSVTTCTRARPGRPSVCTTTTGINPDTVGTGIGANPTPVAIVVQ